MADDPALCALDDVSQVFTMPNGAPRTVLDHVSVEVHAGEVVALLGPSGCGKSTILRILAGLIRPSEGRALYHGEPLVGLNPGVAIVFQSFALYPWMTIQENVSIVLEAKGVAAPERDARVERVLGLVGLAGFEDAYPRELSGGMKQRVGMARALAVEPEMLFMDEPFSQVDALTAESLRAEVLDIWSAPENKTKSILMVSHDIKEVAYMADRIVVLGANPGVVRSVFENRLRRPRDQRSPAMLRLVDRLHDIITGHEMPDEQPAQQPAAGADVVEPLPHVMPSEVAGLLEFVAARGGRVDVVQIAAETRQEFGRVIAVVKAAEQLDFVDTPKRLVELLPRGAEFVDASPEDRKVIFREQLLALVLFKKIRTMITVRKQVSKKLLIQAIRAWLPMEDLEATFQVVVSWSRYADLFAYDEAEEVLRPA
ncbi:MAG TPA: nitrate/sulfonate/bicarbonate ABC transporter ATP-binding protein [Minicystis sp.]|nr:nitrate/sulfonate/bicarbonate ABC transporter ATP-binding protein [Minicystis sp.]